jgi:hypothetical protein
VAVEAHTHTTITIQVSFCVGFVEGMSRVLRRRRGLTGSLINR